MRLLPLPRLVLLGQLMQDVSNLREARNEPSEVVDKSQIQSDFGDVGRYGPVGNGISLELLRGDAIGTN